MKKVSAMLAAVLGVLLLSGCTQASDVNSNVNSNVTTVLAKAQKEGRLVMLELGSVGCVPCERMKPVMQKLRDTYKGKLEVLFIDVRVDRPSAVRFGVTMIPTQVFLDKRGKAFHRHVGFYDFDEIVPVLYQAGLPRETNVQEKR